MKIRKTIKGFTMIPRFIGLDGKLPPAAKGILIVIIDKYFMNQFKAARISYSDFHEMVGLTHNHIKPYLNELVQRSLIEVIGKKGHIPLYRPTENVMSEFNHKRDEI